MKVNYLLILLIFCTLSRSLHGQGVLVDQCYTPAYNNNFDFYPTRSGEGTPYLFAQEFTPAFASLNFVDLYIDSNASVLTHLAIHVEICSQTPEGETVGKSSSISYSSSFRGEARLMFPQAISLIPGSLYVIKPYEDEFQGGRYIGIGVPRAGVGPGYDGGNWMYNNFGVDTTGRDIWFREGVAVPEPSPLVFGGLTIITLYLLRRRLLPRA